MLEDADADGGGCGCGALPFSVELFGDNEDGINVTFSD